MKITYKCGKNSVDIYIVYASRPSIIFKKMYRKINGKYQKWIDIL